MDKAKIIVVTVALIFSVGVPSAMGLRVILQPAGWNQPKVPDFGTTDLESTFLAQNDNGENETAESSKPGSEAKGSEAESKQADDDKSKSSKAKSKPLKPFVPSEKIPGDQAVDFPVDI